MRARIRGHRVGTASACRRDMRTFILLALLAPAACAAQSSGVAAPLTTTAATVGAHTATNPAAAFEHYRTFSFGASEGPPAGYRWSPRAAEVQRRLRPMITAALTARGYAAVPEKGDILIMFGSGRREVSEHEGSSIGTGWLPDDENQDFAEGALVIDAFDGGIGNMVWHGATQANIDPDRIDEGQLRRSVQKLVASFPAAGSS
jgi:hypothetical protein